MKKRLIITLIILLIPLIVKAETCDEKMIELDSITCTDKSRNIDDCNDAYIRDEDNKIELNLEVREIGDNATYEITIKNNSDEEYEIDKEDFNLSSDYIDYEITIKDNNNKIDPDSSAIVYLTVTYANEVPNDKFINGIYVDNKDLQVKIFSTKVEEDNPIINPETRAGALLVIGILILIISATILVLFKKKRYKEIFVLTLTSIITIPLTVYAICSYNLVLSANISINSDPTIADFLNEFYSSSFHKYQGLVTDEVDKTVEATNVYFANTQESNNVLFAGYCWQIIRTTEQGGLKLIYNGVPVNNTCPSGRSYTDRIIGKSKYSNTNNSLAYVGYMYNTVYPKTSTSYWGNRAFGNDVTYENGMYTLVDTQDTKDNYHKYTCLGDNASTCEKVLYYITYEALTLENGKTIEDAIDDMFFADDVNTYDSTIKAYIDNWYE